MRVFLNFLVLVVVFSQSAIAAYIPKPVTTGTRNYRVESIYFGGSTPYGSVCTSSPCTIWTQTGGISSVSRASTGLYTINFTSGVFSATPTCMFDCNDTIGDANWHEQKSATNTWSATAVKLYATNGSYILSDAQCSAVCFGPK